MCEAMPMLLVNDSNLSLHWLPPGHRDPLQVDNPEREGNGRQSFQKRTKAFGLGLPSLSPGQISAVAQSNYLQAHLSQHTVLQHALITAAPYCTVCPYMVLEAANERNVK